MANMGHPIPPTNGVANMNGSSGEAGPSTNGHSRVNRRDEGHSRGIELVQPEGSLMYEDDRGWTEESLNDVAGDHSMGEGDEVERRPRASRTGKRMPVDREEVVRLILQGLRDIGYQSVLPRALTNCQLTRI